VNTTPEQFDASIRDTEFEQVRVRPETHGSEAEQALALQSAGYAAGAALFADLGGSFSEPPADAPEGSYWHSFSLRLSERGCGSFTANTTHPGAGLLTRSLPAGAVASPALDVGCAFTTGLLAHVLTRTAGAPVAVLEVRCRARGDGTCVFAFGSESTIACLYATLLDGKPVEHALAELTR